MYRNNTKKKGKEGVDLLCSNKEDCIADTFSSGWFCFSAFATWVTDHRANIYTLKERIRGCLDK